MKIFSCMAKTLTYRSESKSGWKVVYFPSTRIIHFKGKVPRKQVSTTSSIFISRCRSLLANTTPVGRAQRSNFIWLAILITAIISYLKHNIADHLYKLMDLLLLIAVQTGLKKIWQSTTFIIQIIMPTLHPWSIRYFGTSLLWVFSLWFLATMITTGNHADIGPASFGTLVILIIYSLCPLIWEAVDFLFLPGQLLLFFAYQIYTTNWQPGFLVFSMAGQPIQLSYCSQVWDGSFHCQCH